MTSIISCIGCLASSAAQVRMICAGSANTMAGRLTIFAEPQVEPGWGYRSSTSSSAEWKVLCRLTKFEALRGARPKPLALPEIYRTSVNFQLAQLRRGVQGGLLPRGSSSSQREQKLRMLDCRRGQALSPSPSL